MKSEELIAVLGHDAVPVRRLQPPHRRLLNWLALVIPVLAAVVAVAGPRPELAHNLTELRFVLIIAAAVATGVTAAWAALASTIPGQGGWRLAVPLAPASLWLAVLGQGCWREWLVHGPDSLLPALRVQCLPEIALVSVVPVVALVLALRRGAPVQPGITAMLAALAAAAMASAALEFFHHSEAAIVALVWHFGGVALLSGLAGVMGRRILAIPTPVRAL